MKRFIGSTSPNISVTKWHDIEEGVFFYDLYVNGKIEGRFTLSELMKKIEEILYDVCC